MASVAKKYVLVSGGAGGIGAALCEALAAHGFIPIVGYRSDQAAAEDIAHKNGGGAIALDLASEDSINSALASLPVPPDALAGVALLASPPPELLPFGKISPADMSRQLQVNVIGPQMLLAGLIKSHFRKTKSGFVAAVLTEAMGTESTAATGMSAYVIAKYGLQGLLKTVQAEYPWLHVVSVSPGFTETPMLKGFDVRYLEMVKAQKAFATPASVAESLMHKIMER